MRPKRFSCYPNSFNNFLYEGSWEEVDSYPIFPYIMEDEDDTEEREEKENEKN